jgi:holliday junction DNA helicase RuvA
MISLLEGKYIECSENSVTLSVGGVHYEVFVSKKVLSAVDQKNPGELVRLVIYHYVQSDPSKMIPVLIGFQNKIEREFFEKFITVSGIGPKAALKALSVPISQIAMAIDAEDTAFLKTLRGVGEQKAREIVAKLRGKVGRFGLIQDGETQVRRDGKDNIRQEALSVLSQLQYKTEDARRMVDGAMRQNPKISSVEDLLNEVYRQKAVQPATR